MAGIVVSFYIWLWRDRALVADGNVALALVVDRTRVSARYYSYTAIRYDFLDSRQGIRTGKGIDYGDACVEGTAIAIFYDAQNPTKTSPRSGSLYRVQESRVSEPVRTR
jgi:hypothetical protein